MPGYCSARRPVVLIGGTEDAAPTPGRLREVEDELAARGKDDLVVLVDGGHGFMEPTHPGYAAQSAQGAWTAVLEFLDGARP